MPNSRRAGMRIRTFPCPDELWEQAKGRADGRPMSEVLRALLTHYVDMPQHEVEAIMGMVDP